MKAMSWKRRAARVTATLLAASAVVLAQLVVPAALVPASAATIDTNAWYVLVNRHSGKAMEVSGQSTADGAGIAQRTRTDATAQQWRFVSSGSGYYRLQNRNSGKVVDVRDRSTANGAEIVQWADLNGTNQQFSVQDVATGYVQLMNRNSGRSLDLWEWSTADGARISQYDDTNATNQQWQLVTVGGGGGTPPASYPNPGTVTGATTVHDPEVVKRPDGTYLLAHTGDGITLKTSSNRTAWSSAGAAFPGSMSWAHG